MRDFGVTKQEVEWEVRFLFFQKMMIAKQKTPHLRGFLI
ncbi:hypothetical protein BPJM79_20689 [Bacillus pumilus]